MDASTSPTKKCPFCAEDIRAEAIKCRHCGSMLGAPAPAADDAPVSVRTGSPARVAVAVVGGVVALAALVGALQGGEKRTDGPRATATPAAADTPQPSQAEPPPAAERREVPVDPAPPSAAKAGEVPELEARLAGEPAYRDIWDAGRRRDLTLLLGAVSQALATDNGRSFNIEVATGKELERSHLNKAAITLMMIFARVGRFPTDFDQHVRSLLGSVRSMPHLGVWGSGGDPSGAFDIAALAAWTMRDRPEYLRELIACRRAHGGWTKVDAPFLAYLATERGALERLALLDDLTDAERARLGELKVPTLDAMRLWQMYEANEVAADDEIKGKRVRVVGSLQAITKDITDGVVLLLASPNELMPTHANLRKEDAPMAARLRKGQAVTITCTAMGRLMGSPILDECSL